MSDLPRFALSIMQPWAWLIVNGHKTLENRDWKPWNRGLQFRGPVAIHAGKKFDESACGALAFGVHPVLGGPAEYGPEASLAEMMAGDHCGGIVGVGEVVDVITQSDDEWFVGPYALVIANARPVPFVPVKGALGFFDWRGWQERRVNG